MAENLTEPADVGGVAAPVTAVDGLALFRRSRFPFAMLAAGRSHAAGTLLAFLLSQRRHLPAL